MGKGSMNDLRKRRIASAREESELHASDEAYERIIREAPPSTPAVIRDLPLDKRVPFFTADIGFKPYFPAMLQALAGQLSEEGLMVRITVRPTMVDKYEILAGHNRASAAKLAGWAVIPAEIGEADDARAIVIAMSTNLIQRQELGIIERGKAYKALLDAKNRHGQWNANEDGQENLVQPQKVCAVSGQVQQRSGTGKFVPGVSAGAGEMSTKREGTAVV